MAEAVIDVIIGTAKAQSGATALKGTVDGIKGSFLDLTAKVFVAQQAFHKIWDQAKRGAQFEETMARINRQTAAYHTNAHLMVGDLQAISQHTLSIDKAAQMASRGLAMGLNPDLIRTFSQAADLLKDQIGGELPAAFDTITQAAITGRSQVLANIGVYVDLEDEVRKLAVSTNRTTEQITKQERAMLAAKAMAGQVEAAQARLGDGALSDAKKLEQLENRFASLTLSMSQGFKGAVIGTIDLLGKLGSALEPLERFKPSNMAAPYIRAKGLDAGQPGNPIWEQVMGQAIVQDTTGNLARQRDSFTNVLGSTPRPELPTAVRGGQLEAERERREKALTGELDRTRAGLDAAGRLFESDAQRQLITLEDLVSAKGDLRLRELATIGETLSRQQQLEEEFYAQRVAIGFETTQERITAEETYRSKVFDITQALTANAQAFGQQSVLNAEERAAAREAAEQRLGQRLIESMTSRFEIEETLRRQALQDTETYYQGEFDMAHARFAGDQELAAKERQLLREQLAFKLRLTKEEVDRMLFLRTFGELQGANDILDRGDPTLSQRAREGILESGTAKDMRLAERANNNFFAGWARGLQDYTQRTEGAFNLSNDMARRAAQGMEQGFQRFFFDSMEGKFQSFKDVLSGVAHFANQIMSQVLAQITTVGLINPAASAFGSWFSPGAASIPAAQDFSGSNFPGFSQRNGGVGDYGSGTVGVLHGIEAVVPLPDGRTIPVSMQGAMPEVNVPISIQIHNSAPNTEVTAQHRPGSGNERQEIEIFIMQTVNKGTFEGRLDKTLSQRFRLSPGGG